MFRNILKFLLVALALSLLLFSDNRFGTQCFSGCVFFFAAQVCQNRDTQWLVFLFLTLYFITFILLARARIGIGTSANSRLWLVSLWILASIVALVGRLSSTQALIFFGSIVAGLGIACCGKPKVGGFQIFPKLVATALTALLASVPILAPSSGYFGYRGNSRWSGPWGNPNIAGLLMGVGLVLVLGLALERWHARVYAPSFRGGLLRFRLIGKMHCLPYLLVSVCPVYGLLFSYSRGAWLATACALAYLLWQAFVGHAEKVRRSSNPAQYGLANEKEIFPFRWFDKNKVALAVILSALVVLTVEEFWHVDERIVHRAVSVANANDFSWRNRMDAWIGAMQIIGAHPWFGSGWGQMEQFYQYYYLSPKSTESAAIEMNDFLAIGATLGAPALFCFGIYVWVVLGSKSGISRQTEENDEKTMANQEFVWLCVTCRAAAMVLLIGFWFDGGLFKLATGATFWILLELGRADGQKHEAAARNQ